MAPTNREELHDILVAILCSNCVYLDPPENLKMGFPRIIYRKEHIGSKFADNSTYLTNDTYTATLITDDPESDLVRDMLNNISQCKHDSHYVSDGLHHDLFTIKI